MHRFTSLKPLCPGPLVPFGKLLPTRGIVGYLEEHRRLSQGPVNVPVDIVLLECYTLGTWGEALQPYIYSSKAVTFFFFPPSLPFFFSGLSFLGRFLLRRDFLGFKKSLKSAGLKN